MNKICGIGECNPDCCEISMKKYADEKVREFAEWLSHQDEVLYDPVSKDFYTCDEHCNMSTLSIDEVLAEWQKEAENEHT